MKVKLELQRRRIDFYETIKPSNYLLVKTDTKLVYAVCLWTGIASAAVTMPTQLLTLRQQPPPPPPLLVSRSLTPLSLRPPCC